VIFCFVPSVLVSGIYYNGGVASGINALKAGKTTFHSVRTSQGRSDFRIKSLKNFTKTENKSARKRKFKFLSNVNIRISL
jgi:hypothetical protein